MIVWSVELLNYLVNTSARYELVDMYGVHIRSILSFSLIKYMSAQIYLVRSCCTELCATLIVDLLLHIGA